MCVELRPTNLTPNVVHPCFLCRETWWSCSPMDCVTTSMIVRPIARFCGSGCFHIQKEAAPKIWQSPRNIMRIPWNLLGSPKLSEKAMFDPVVNRQFNGAAPSISDGSGVVEMVVPRFTTGIESHKTIDQCEKLWHFELALRLYQMARSSWTCCCSRQSCTLDKIPQTSDTPSQKSVSYRVFIMFTSRKQCSSILGLPHSQSDWMFCHVLSQIDPLNYSHFCLRHGTVTQWPIYSPQRQRRLWVWSIALCPQCVLLETQTAAAMTPATGGARNRRLSQCSDIRHRCN